MLLKLSLIHLCVLHGRLDGLDALPPLVLGKPHVGDQLGGVVLILLSCSAGLRIFSTQSFIIATTSKKLTIVIYKQETNDF